MGPKKKAKSPKKTKKELEEKRRLQEEEEERIREENEKRVEKDRLQQEEELARRREENARNRAAELDRLALEYEEVKQFLQAKAKRLAELLHAQKEAKDWDNYLACHPRLDVQVESDMNLFLNSWELDTTTLEPDLPSVTAACESTIEVLEDLTFVAADAFATNDNALQAQCEDYIARLQQLVIDKIDLTTAHVLRYSDIYADVTAVPINISNNDASHGEVKSASVSPKTGRLQLGLWVNVPNRGTLRSKKVEFKELGIEIDLPKAVVTQSFALRVTRWPFDVFSSCLESGSNDVAFRVFSLELLGVPLPPQRARGWIMREIPDKREQLKRLQYPFDGTTASAALPIKAKLTLPKDVLWSTSDAVNGDAVENWPRIGWWNAKRMHWEEEGVSDIDFEEETNSVTFSTLKLTHLALLVRRDRCFIKRSWRLRMATNPYDGNFADDSNDVRDKCACLTLSTALFPVVEFEITPDGARLLQPSLPQLEAIRKKSLPPGELLTRLARAGIDLCPPVELKHKDGEEDEYDADAKQVSIPPGFVPKLKMLEDRVIDEISSVVAGFEITDGNSDTDAIGAAAARWPEAMGSSQQIVFSVKEMTWPTADIYDRNEQLTEEDHASTIACSAASVLILAEVDNEASGGGVKFRLDRMGDSDAERLRSRDGNEDADGGGSREGEDIYDTHMHLRRALDQISSPDTRDRLDKSHVLFELTLQKMLRLLRLLSYSLPFPIHGKETANNGSSLAPEAEMPDINGQEEKIKVADSIAIDGGDANTQ